MYKGKKEIKTRFIADQEFCYRYDDKHNKRWIEIFVPPEDNTNYFTKNNRVNRAKWGTFMVETTQVAFIPNTDKNLISMVPGVVIPVSVKDHTRKPLSTEYLSPAQINARWLKYYYNINPSVPSANKNIPSKDIYKAWIDSGLRLNIFINKIHTITI